MILAAWSGPRNLSTACMYAFGARPDFEVVDEPFYAAYLAATGLDHPMRAAIIEQGETDSARVARACAAGPVQAPHVYQKHMTQHMIAGFDRSWLSKVDAHIFLIRHPARVLFSYAAKRENPSLEDIGFVQQAELFDAVRGAGLRHVVIDSFDIRRAPEAMMRGLCAALELTFDPRMLRWPSGGHQSDGIWASHWYDAVHRSTQFAGKEAALPILPEPLQVLAEAALPHYDHLKSHALVPDD